MRFLGKTGLLLLAAFCVAALFLAPIRVRAEGLVSIDTDKKYEGMKTSFARGYMPVIQKNTMKLVVPFTVNAPLADDSLLVGVSFEREENSPFVFRNYQKRVKKSGEGVYLYKCKIKLQKNRVNGQYPLHLTVQAQAGEELIRQEFTIYVEISDGKAASAEGNSGEQESLPEESGTGESAAEAQTGEPKEEVNHQPRILITQNSLRRTAAQADGGRQSTLDAQSSVQGTAAQSENGGQRDLDAQSSAQDTAVQAENGEQGAIDAKNSVLGTSIQAGSSAVWILNAKNCSSNQSLKNVKVTLISEGNEISFEKTAWYFERVAAGGSMDLSQNITAEGKAAEGQVSFQLQFEYEDKKGNAYNSAETVRLSVRQVQQAELVNVDFPESIYEADTDTLTFQVQNTGQAVIYNAKVRLEAVGLFPEKEMFLGNIEAGTSADGEISVFAGTLDMDDEGNVSKEDVPKYGDTAASVIFPYENEQGEVTEQTTSFHTAIKKPEVVELKVEKQEEKTNQWWITILFFVFLTLILIIIWLFLRMKYYQRMRMEVYERTKYL